MGIGKIKNILTEEKIPRPSACACDNGSNYHRYFEDNEENRYVWSNNSVRAILRNPVYAGHMAGYKRPKLSMKSEKRVIVPIEDWEIIRDTHEGIVSDEEFELVQRLMTSRRKGVKGSNGYDNIFAGLIKCDTCGYALSSGKANRRNRPEMIDNILYTCTNYKNNGTKACTQHKIEARELHQVVLEDIRKHSKMALLDADTLLDDILGNIDAKSKEDGKRLNKELTVARKRLSDIDTLFEKLFESHVEGKISERNYLTMSKKYETEQSDLEVKINDLEITLQQAQSSSNDVKQWIDSIKEYTTITELTASLLNTLIDKITVTEIEVIDGHKVQTVNIYYKFIGCIGN